MNAVKEMKEMPDRSMPQQLFRWFVILSAILCGLSIFYLYFAAGLLVVSGISVPGNILGGIVLSELILCCLPVLMVFSIVVSVVFWQKTKDDTWARYVALSSIILASILFVLAVQLLRAANLPGI